MHTKLFIIVIVLTLLGCTRSKERSIQPARDYALVHQDLSEIIPLIIHTGQSQNYLLDRFREGADTLNSCATYTYLQGDTVNIAIEPIQYEINFAQCYDHDGDLKNGSLKCILYDYFNVDSSSCFMSFDAFSLNNNIVTGSLNIKRISGNSYKVSTSALRIIIGTREIHYDGSITYQMSTGTDVNSLYDNKLVVLDNGFLTDRYGSEVEIHNEGISKALDCHWFYGGFVELADSEGESLVLDFGAGSCDSDATITISDEETAIKL